jgi:hypothetical protein
VGIDDREGDTAAAVIQGRLVGGVWTRFAPAGMLLASTRSWGCTDPIPDQLYKNFGLGI